MLPRFRPGDHAHEPDAAPANPVQRILALVHEWVIHIPYYDEVRLYWRDLQKERQYWPVLLPLLAWIFWRTYRAERRALKQR